MPGRSTRLQDCLSLRCLWMLPWMSVSRGMWRGCTREPELERLEVEYIFNVQCIKKKACNVYQSIVQYTLVNFCIFGLLYNFLWVVFTHFCWISSVSISIKQIDAICIIRKLLPAEHSLLQQHASCLAWRFHYMMYVSIQWESRQGSHYILTETFWFWCWL